MPRRASVSSQGMEGFGEPCGFLPMPESLRKPRSEGVRPRRPQPAAAPPPRPPLKRPAADPPEVLLPDRSALVGESVGRCRARLADTGVVVAVPYLPRDVAHDLEDEDRELLLVELRGPDGRDSWFHAPEVQAVRIEARDGTTTDVPIRPLRVLVNHRLQDDLARNTTRRLDRSVYRLCSPIRGSPLLLCLVPSADALALAAA